MSFKGCFCAKNSVQFERFGAFPGRFPGRGKSLFHNMLQKPYGMEIIGKICTGPEIYRRTVYPLFRAPGMCQEIEAMSLN
jgi:hypothetical protein